MIILSYDYEIAYLLYLFRSCVGFISVYMSPS